MAFMSSYMEVQFLALNGSFQDPRAASAKRASAISQFTTLNQSSI